MKKTLQINGQIIEAKVFKTMNAATNFINKKEGREIVFLKARQIWVNV